MANSPVSNSTREDARVFCAALAAVLLERERQFLSGSEEPDRARPSRYHAGVWPDGIRWVQAPLPHGMPLAFA